MFIPLIYVSHIKSLYFSHEGRRTSLFVRVSKISFTNKGEGFYNNVNLITEVVNIMKLRNLMYVSMFATIMGVTWDYSSAIFRIYSCTCYLTVFRRYVIW